METKSFRNIGANGEELTEDQASAARIEQGRAMKTAAKKRADLLASLDTWLADDSGYDEEAWPRLKEKVEESRMSSRRRFGGQAELARHDLPW